MERLVFIGATSLWKLYHEIVMSEQKPYGLEIVGFVDDDPAKISSGYAELPVLGSMKELPSLVKQYELTSGAVLLGPRNMKLRKKMAMIIEEAGLKAMTFIHRKSILADEVTIGKGAIIGIGVILSQNAEVNDHCCVLAGATVGHDNSVGKYAFIASGAILQGNVKVGESVFIGPGVIVTDGVTIGAGSIIGAGSLVNKNIQSSVLAYGSPAKIIKQL
jgi:sugar O-acyltransferase (sialic acid O-acetyltransferase NeuD family)